MTPSVGLPSPHLLGAAALAYAALSLLWSPGDPLLTATWLGICTATYAIGAIVPDIRPFWLGILILFYLNLPFAFWDFYALHADSYGLMGNPNFLGLFAAMLFAASVAYGWRYHLIPLATAALWSSCRSAVIIIGLLSAFALYRRWPRWAGVAFACLTAATLAMKTDVGYLSLFYRLGIWQDTLDHLTILGHGAGSYLTTYASWPVHRNLYMALAPHPYNDFLEALSDLGIGANLVWFWIALCLAGRNRADRLVVLTFCLLGLTYFAFWVVGPLFTLALGHLTTEEAAYGPLETQRQALHLR